MKTRAVVLVVLASGCGLSVPPYLGPDSGSDGPGRDSPAGYIPEPARYHLMVADYDNNLGLVEYDSQAGCAHRPPAALAGQCLLPCMNNLGQCAASTFCEQGANGQPLLDGGSVCVTYDNDPSAVLRGTGRSLRLDFDLALASQYSGYTESLMSNTPRCAAKGPFNLDGLGFSHLTFWIRLQTLDGKPIDMEIAMKDAQGVQTSKSGEGKRRLSEFAPCVTAGEWTKYCIKFDDLRIAAYDADGGVVVNTQNLAEVNFAFARNVSDSTSKSHTGTVWLDEVAFELLE